MIFETARGKIYYEVIGKGVKNIVLLHNAGGNKNFFTHQLEFLSQIGRVLTIDFLGHGLSEKKELDHTIEEAAQEIIALCQQCGMNDVSVIGLNYGADVGIEMAFRSKMISSLVLIDPPICMSQEVRHYIQDHITVLENPSLPDFISELVQKSFINPETINVEIANNAFNQVERSALASVYRNLLLWDETSSEKIKAISIPMLCILTDAALCSMETLQLLNRNLLFGKVVKSLYWATLEVPDQINPMIKRFL